VSHEKFEASLWNRKSDTYLQETVQ